MEIFGGEGGPCSISPCWLSQDGRTLTPVSLTECHKAELGQIREYLACLQEEKTWTDSIDKERQKK